MSNSQTSYFKAVTLGHYLSELPKSTLPASVASDNGAFPFYCSSSIVKYCNTYLVDKPTVLMGTGGVASVNFGSEKFAYSTDTWAFRSKDEEELKTEFIFRALQRKLPKIDYRAFEGSGLKHLRKNDVKKLLIRAPVNKLVTEKILTILREADQAIEKTEALIEKYQQIKAGLMHDLFTRGIGADGKLRHPREEAPELYQSTPIGWIPKDWNYSRIKKIVRSAQYGISTSLNDSANGIPVLRMNNIQSNVFDVTDLKYSIDVEAYRLKLNKGDVLYNRTNSMEHVGKTAIWRDELPECSFASYLVRINLLDELILPSFFSHLMSQVSIQNELRRYATPAVQQVNINPTNLQKVYISYPSDIDEQRLISERIDKLDNKKRIEVELLNKLKCQKAGLMHDLLTGKVQVSIQNAEAAHV